jgi:hypothetical protein
MQNMTAEIHFPSDNMNRNAKRYLNKNMNTFQQSIEPEVLYANVGRAAPPSLASQGASHPGVKENRKKSGETGQTGQTEKPLLPEKKLSRNAIYEEIHFQMNKVKDGDRYTRAKIYLSLKTDLDVTFSVTLSGSVTTAIHETLAMAREKKEQSIVDLINKLKEQHGSGLLLGRLKYKPRNGYKTDFHKNIIPYVLIAVYATHDGWGSTLYMLNEQYDFEMTNNIDGKQKQFYDVIGVYRKTLNIMDESDAFSD